MTTAQLLKLYARRDKLAGQLRDLDRQIARGGREYARTNHGCVFMRPEAIRAAVEAEAKEAA